MTRKMKSAKWDEASTPDSKEQFSVLCADFIEQLDLRSHPPAWL